ncbi:MAG: tetratricopeptide repeat protein [Gallionella sp.]
MNAMFKRTFQNGILAFCLASSLALADIADDFKRASDLYDKQEMVDAALIFKKLALQNYLPAQSRLGDLYDYTEAHELAVGWYIMAAFQGDAPGAYGLGRAYVTGFGIKKDPEQALFWYKFSADKGNVNAIKVMENAYRIGNESGLPVKVDLKRAEYWKAKKTPLEEAKKKEDEKNRQAILKEMYEKQQALKKEIEEATKKSR